MNLLVTKLAPVCVLAALAFGCGKSSQPVAISPDQVPAAVENAFKDASPEAKNIATEAVDAMKSNDDAKAVVDLQKLFEMPDLTPEQREVAQRSVMALNEKLRAAASQGDQGAAQALQDYRSSK